MEKYFEIIEGNLNIKCKLYCNTPRNINYVVVSCHGFGGNKDNNATKKIAEELLYRYNDFAVISFDWPCHGDDVRQKLKLAYCNDYLEGVINYIKNELGVNDIYSQATSFGGYLMLKYISEHPNPFKKIALRCPAVNMYTAMTENILETEQVENIKRGKIEFSGFERKIKITNDVLEEIRENDISNRKYIDLAEDILIMHGTNDELISYDFVKKFAEENEIEFVTIEGADHRYKDPAKLRECINLIRDFYKMSM